MRDELDNTALHLAVVCNKLAIVSCLLRYGANVKLVNVLGEYSV